MRETDISSSELDAAAEAQVARHAALRAKARDTRRRFGTNAIIRVGDGRGFVVETRSGDRHVITAAHCLPELPLAASFLSELERSHRLLAALDEAPWALGCCAFVDPVADLAILSALQIDEAFDDLTGYLRPLRIVRAGPPKTVTPVRMLGLDGEWFSATAYHSGSGVLWIKGLTRRPSEHYAGLSGSPILDTQGRAIGVFVTSGNIEPHGPQPTLDYNLPAGWWGQLFGRRPRGSDA